MHAAAIAFALLAATPDPGAPPAPPSPMPPRYLRTLAHDPGGYDPARGGGVSDLLLGDLLFHSPRTLGPAAQRLRLSCAACHPSGAAHGTLRLPPEICDRPGNVDLSTAYFRAGAENHVRDFVNIPSLRGARFTPPYGRDGRTASLREFIGDVVESEFAGAPLPARQLRALVRYVEDLDFCPTGARRARAPHRRRQRARPPRRDPVHEAARRLRRWQLRHLPPAVGVLPRRQGPPAGHGQPPSPHAIDDGFDTPTLLGIAETAPYFHDGRFATLVDVVAWFDRSFALGLGAAGEADLTAYLTAVGASDRTADDRPPAQVMIDSFVYLELLLDGEDREDRGIWMAALAASRDELARHPEAPAVIPAITRARAQVASVLARTQAGAPLAPMRTEIARLRRDLFRLAADWAGAASAARE